MSWLTRTQKIKSSLQKKPRLLRSLQWSGRLFLALVLIDIGYLVGITPDWQRYASGEIRASAFIEDYKLKRRQDNSLPLLKWLPVPMSRIPDHVVKAVIVAEDSRFYEHDGFDEEAFKKAMEYNLAKKRIVYGASTISQQTVKNLFLSPSRNPLRKWHEFVLTFLMERNLPKERILELYLNVAEFGKGVYGVQAASLHYWGKPVSKLGISQATELAATLPAPVKHNPSTQTNYFVKHSKKIRKHLRFYKI